jgi:hypothetical protein
MTELKDVQKQLVLASKKLTSLEEQVSKVTDIEDSLFKIPVFFSEFFTFPEFSLGKQEKTIVNGADDAHITKIVYTRYKQVLAEGVTSSPLNTTIKEVDPFLEFRWNYRLASTQARYLSQANSVDMSSRRSLGYSDVGLPLTLAKPLYFAAGDAITIEVEALLNKGEFTGFGHSIHVTLCGYRTGVMV